VESRNQATWGEAGQRLLSDSKILITGLNITNNESYEFIHPLKWKPSKVGDFEQVKVWVSGINGNVDENPVDDTLEHSAFVNLGLSANKKVLIEEFSTAPCGYCPEGHIFLRDIIKDYPNVIGIIHHSGYKSDSMTIPESVTIAEEFAMGAPTACIDRILWPDKIKVAIGRNEWEDKAVEMLSKKAPVEIDLGYSWNEAYRISDIYLDLNFIDYPKPGDMRINIFIMEDSVIGLGTGYDQTNYFDDDYGHEFYGLGNPIVGYVHQHVIRAVPTSTWGESGIIPSNVGPGQKFSRKYVYTVPPMYKAEDMSIIAFVSYFPQNQGESWEILNAEVKHNLLTGIKEFNSSVSWIKTIYPNPFSEYAIIEFENPGNKAFEINLYDLTGKLLLKQKIYSDKYKLYRKNLSPGIYLIELSEEQTYRAKVIIQ